MKKRELELVSGGKLDRVDCSGSDGGGGICRWKWSCKSGDSGLQV
jgi:hypothetical protein